MVRIKILAKRFAACMVLVENVTELPHVAFAELQLQR